MSYRLRIEQNNSGRFTVSAIRGEKKMWLSWNGVRDPRENHAIAFRTPDEAERYALTWYNRKKIHRSPEVTLWEEEHCSG